MKSDFTTLTCCAEANVSNHHTGQRQVIDFIDPADLHTFLEEPAPWDLGLKFSKKNCYPYMQTKLNKYCVLICFDNKWLAVLIHNDDHYESHHVYKTL